MLTPILITMLFSEPLMDSGYLYLLLFCTLPKVTYTSNLRMARVPGKLNRN